MAVQAQFPYMADVAAVSGARETSVDYVVGNGGLEELLASQQQSICWGPLLGDLACNSRKRPRNDQAPTPAMAAPHSAPGGGRTLLLPTANVASAGMTSTSGRTACGGGNFVGELLPCHSRHRIEMDTLLRMQSERMRSGLEAARKRQCRAILAAAEQRMVHKLAQYEAELEIAKRRNMALEEKIQELGSEAQVWYAVAKNHEAIAAGLRSTLQQLILPASTPTARDAADYCEEGYGDSDCAAFPTPVADDALSCCVGGDDEDHANKRTSKFMCKECGEADATVLLLPCRHLCLCRSCEPTVPGCPVCGAAKSTCLQILFA